jgi:cAMP-dependent protein kinase regulator
MGPGSGFGELALLYNDKRSATIEAVDDCETYSLEGSIFKTIIIKSSVEKRSLQAGFLDKIKLFDSLDKFQKLRLVDGLQAFSYT